MRRPLRPRLASPKYPFLATDFKLSSFTVFSISLRQPLLPRNRQFFTPQFPREIDLTSAAGGARGLHRMRLMSTVPAYVSVDEFEHGIAAELSECLLRTIEAAEQVQRRYQFFLWTQGEMQRLLPHKICVCGVYDHSRRDLNFEVLHSLPLPDAALSELSCGYSALMRHLLEHWHAARQRPVFVDLQEVAARDSASAQLVQAGYRRMLVHAVVRPARPRELESFFVFANQELQPRSSVRHALGVLTPYLHSTYQRVHITERELGGVNSNHVPSSESARGVLITAREKEVLRWVREGLSNQQISEKLGISALTVKNHVQKILRKLDATNRTQAVAKALALNSFGAGSDHLA